MDGIASLHAAVRVGAQAADPAVAAGTPWWVAAVLVALPVLGTVLVARAPVWLEKVKQRSKKNDPSTPPTPAPVPAVAQADARVDAALDLAEQALRDAWRERDTANQRAERLQLELDREQDKNSEQAVTIGELRTPLAGMRGRRGR